MARQVRQGLLGGWGWGMWRDIPATSHYGNLLRHFVSRHGSQQWCNTKGKNACNDAEGLCRITEITNRTPRPPQKNKGDVDEVLSVAEFTICTLRFESAATLSLRLRFSQTLGSAFRLVVNMLLFYISTCLDDRFISDCLLYHSFCEPPNTRNHAPNTFEHRLPTETWLARK